MVARHDAAQASLMAQLKARRVKKTYLALVQGNVAAAVGRIEAPIGETRAIAERYPWSRTGGPRRPATTAPARAGAARMASSACSCMPGGSSSPRRRAKPIRATAPLPPELESVLDGLRDGGGLAR